MNPAELQQALNSLGVVRIGGSNVCACPSCQSEEIDPEAYRLYVSAGGSYPVVCHCVRCGVSKPTTEEERKHNRQIARKAYLKTGLPLSLFYERMPAEEIRRLWGQVRIGGAVPTFRDEGRANDGILHNAYSSLLSKLELTDRHRRWLAKRGLDADWAFDRGYRTAPTSKGAFEIASDLRSIWGTPLTTGVPGLTSDRWLTREGALLIPSRNQSGQIVAVKQRLSTAGKSGRMRWLSGGGTKAVQNLHIPLGVQIDRESVVFIVEGERKSDALYFHYGQPTVGLPGVGSAGLLAGIEGSLSSVVLALDADDAGRRCELQLGRRFRSIGVDVSVLRWTGAKGPDDAIVKGLTLKMEEWTDEGEGESMTGSPPTKKTVTRFTYGQELKDSDVVDYVRQFQPVLRSELKAFPMTITKLVAQGVLKMKKGPSGQLLQVSDANTTNVP